MQGAACSDSVDGQNKGVSRSAAPFELHFLFLSCCGACQAPLGRLGNVSIIASNSAGMAGKGGGGDDKRIVLHVQVCTSVEMCVPVFVCQLSQLTATVAEPRTLDSINCTCQTGEIINAIAAPSASHYCN